MKYPIILKKFFCMVLESSFNLSLRADVIFFFMDLFGKLIVTNFVLEFTNVREGNRELNYEIQRS